MYVSQTFFNGNVSLVMFSFDLQYSFIVNVLFSDFAISCSHLVYCVLETLDSYVENWFVRWPTFYYMLSLKLKLERN